MEKMKILKSMDKLKNFHRKQYEFYLEIDLVDLSSMFQSPFGNLFHSYHMYHHSNYEFVL
jgi:hypothetical protein